MSESDKSPCAGMANMYEGTSSQKEMEGHSHTYGPQLKRLMHEHGLSRRARELVVAISMNAGNLEGVRHVVSRLPMGRNARQAIAFIQEVCRPGRDVEEGSVPFGYVATADPSVSALVWRRGVRGEFRTYGHFVQNLWCGQLRLDDSVQKENEEYERWIWKAYGLMKGRVGLPFPEQYYQKKAVEEYPLIDNDGRVWEPGISRYKRLDIERYLACDSF